MTLYRFVFASVCLCLLTGMVSVGAEPDGHLVIIGGALRDDNADVGNRIIALAGGPGAKIAVIPAAAAEPDVAAQAIVALLERYGAKAFVVPVSVNLKDRDYRREASSPANVDLINAATGVYFVGGRQTLITGALQKPDGENSPVLNAIWDLYRRGGVIAGSSAGAAIMSKFMFGDPTTVINSIKLDMSDEREISTGLGFVGPELFVDQHAIARGRFARMISLMIKKHYEIGIGIDENTAMVVDKHHNVEIVGYKGAVFIDLKDAIVNKNTQAFNVSRAKISYLDRGDRFNYLTRVFTVVSEKQMDPVNQAKPLNHEKLFSSDFLGNTTIVDLMENLIDSDQSQATGFAIPDPDGPGPETGFRFILAKTAQSQGYWSNAFDSYSVLNMMLDIQPVQIVQPFFSLK